jgi:XTP/dITP diphosphohydrolase
MCDQMLEGMTLKILFATENRGKLEEARRVLSAYGIEVESVRVQLAEPDAGTVEEVARVKLRQAMEKGLNRVLVDDAGIYFKAYPEFPGVLTKRVFAGLGYRGISKLLAGESREAWFEGAVAVCWNGEIRVFKAITKGRIVEEISGDITPPPGFPFDPVFVPEGDSRTLMEMPEEDKLIHSYRRKALQQAAEWILTRV